MSQSVAAPPRAPEYRIEIEPASRRVTVMFGGVKVAESERALILHETRLPDTYYLPKSDVRMELFEATAYRTHCPFKGNASYWTLRVGDQVAENALWGYEHPLPEAEGLRGHVAFYRNRMDAWYEEDEAVEIDPVTEPHAHGNPLVDWLMRDAWEATSIGELVARLARQLSGAGVPVSRVNLMVRTLHPQVLGVVHLWTAEDDQVETRELSHARAGEEQFLSSPLVPIFEGRGGVRRRLEGPDARLDFPILRDLHAAGATDYAAMPIPFSDGGIHALTVATDEPGGFDTEDLGHVHEILPLLSRLVEVHALRRTARTLLDTYLGSYTGKRVLDGSIRRGDGDLIPAIIWFADLRGSTGFSERLPRELYLAHLNRFFECTAGPAIDHGGEVLKFIGDAVLAIFPLRERPDAPRAALDAARDTLSRIAGFHRDAPPNTPRLDVVLALHVGEVTYGNIGIEGRLDFTVTGPAVNEVSRLETLAKQLGQPLLASGRFAERIPDDLESLGVHELRGVVDPIEVFRLRPEPGTP